MADRQTCIGTRQPLLNRSRIKTPRASAWARKYGAGDCSVCGKFVVAHKDGSATMHSPIRGQDAP